MSWQSIFLLDSEILYAYLVTTLIRFIGGKLGDPHPHYIILKISSWIGSSTIQGSGRDAFKRADIVAQTGTGGGPAVWAENSTVSVMLLFYIWISRYVFIGLQSGPPPHRLVVNFAQLNTISATCGFVCVELVVYVERCLDDNNSQAGELGQAEEHPWWADHWSCLSCVRWPSGGEGGLVVGALEIIVSVCIVPYSLLYVHCAMWMYWNIHCIYNTIGNCIVLKGSIWMKEWIKEIRKLRELLQGHLRQPHLNIADEIKLNNKLGLSCAKLSLS